jgi:hypothetical protein
VKVVVRVSRNFKTEAKPLFKKYLSLGNDLANLEKELINNPRLGTSLGKDVFKIRLKITSKGKGKSGGARVISLLETNLIAVTQINSDEEITVNLLSIYDKSDVANISDKELKELIKNFRGT